MPIPTSDVESEILALKTFKRDIILEEWKLFKQMLEHREQWKMEILKPYAEIRFVLEEIGKRWGLNSDIHWLTLMEITEASPLNSPDLSFLREKLAGRKNLDRVFRVFSLPEILSLDQLESIIAGKPTDITQVLNGEPLSPGVAFGEIRFVDDPNLVDLDTWPENVILAAVSTDPGWTPLFLKAKGILVERGGVLSHCAIVAREMSVPAVSGILDIRNRLKNGDQVWVDGNSGHVSRESAEREVAR